MGFYWDWSFPLFKEQLSNYLQLSSWNNGTGFGAPMSYYSSFYLNYIITLLGKIIKVQPELLFYLLVIVCLIILCFIIGKIKNSRNNFKINTLIGLMMIFSPAIFYKLLAGHLNYLVSFVLFIYLVYLLLIRYKDSKINWYLLTFLIGFVGFQIQFFVFTFIFLIIYFLFNKSKFEFKKIIILIISVVLINLPWLSNFILRVNSVKEISNTASSVAFSDLMFAPVTRIIVMAYSPATLLQYAYSTWEFIFFGILTIFILVNAILNIRQWGKNTKIIAINLGIFTLLGTGIFQKIKIPGLSVFYPMLRESGHFAPLIMFFLILTLVHTWPKNIFISRSLAVLCIIFIVINLVTFCSFLPRTDYEKTRESFNSFNESNQTDNATYRILTYPFWNSYGLIFDEPNIKNIRGRRLSNTGWDNFTIFSGKDSISQNVAPQDIKSSLQYRLLQTYNISELEDKNVKYIYDYSNIYNSHLDSYIDGQYYDYNTDLIKNDPDLQKKLLEANPGKIEKVTDNILKIVDYKPRIYGDNVSFEKINSTEYRVSIKNLSKTQDLTFLDNFHKDWYLYPLKNSTNQECESGQLFSQYKTIECKSKVKSITLENLQLIDKESIFDSSHKEVNGFANGWTISKNDFQNIGENYFKQNPDGTINIELVLYFRPQSYLVISLIVSSVTIIALLMFLLYPMLRRASDK